MTLLSDLQTAAAANNRGATCGVAVLLSTLPPEDATDLRQALNQTKPGLPGKRPEYAIPHTIIEQVMRKRDLRLTADTVGRHRAGLCQCPATR